MTTGDVFRAAAKRVRQGWCQGDYYNYETNGVCAVGALCAARGVDMRDKASLDAAIGVVERAPEGLYLKETLGLCWIHIWNDAPDQTAEGVASVFERAADYWDSMETPAIVWTMREDVPA